MGRKLGHFSISIFLIFSLVYHLDGQNHRPLKPENFNSLSKKEQVKLLSKLCWEYREKQTDKALEYGLEGIKIAKAEGFDKELATLYNFVGVVYQDYKYDVPTALSYYNKGLPFSLKIKDSVEIAYVYNNLGDAFYKVGNIPLAFEYGKKSLAMFERVHNKRGIAYSYINLGEVNRISKKYDSALYYFRKVIAIRKTFNDSIGIASANLEIAQTLSMKGQTDSALHYFRVSLREHQQIDNKNYMAYSMQGMGDLYLKRHELDSAYTSFQKALTLCRERKNPTGEIESQLGIAKVLGLRGREKQGEKVLEEALVNAKKSKLIPNILKVYKAKGEFYLRLKEFRKASENYKNYIHKYDSLYSVLQFQTLSEIKDRFQMTEKLHTMNVDLKTHQRDQIYAVVIILLLIVFSVILVLRNRTISRLSEELKQSNKSKDKIFSIISHDLVSPFNVLTGTSELLLEDLESDNVAGAREKGLLIQRISDETYYFISNLLNWARSQQKNIKLYPEVFDLSKLMRNVKSTFEDQAKMKNISVYLNMPAGLKVNADQNLIRIVLVNLLNNALKFTHLNGKIDLSLEKQGDKVKVSVKDNGTGIASDRLAVLFNGEALESQQGTNRETGTGLGLLLCKEFVEMHGSKLHIESQEGVGSEFWFMLPVG